MRPIPTPTTAPDCPLSAYSRQLLDEFVDVIPEFLRNEVTLVAQYVEIERSALQVRAIEGAGSARSKQLALLGLIAACTEGPDDKWDPKLPIFVKRLDAYRASRGLQPF